MPFLPGHKHGGKKAFLLSAELLVVDKLHPEEIRRLISKTGRLAMADIEALLENPTKSVAERAFGRVWKQAEMDGDPRRLEFLLSRVIGKIPDMEPEKEESGAADLSPAVRTALVGALKLASRGG